MLSVNSSLLPSSSSPSSSELSSGNTMTVWEQNTLCVFLISILTVPSFFFPLFFYLYLSLSFCSESPHWKSWGLMGNVMSRVAHQPKTLEQLSCGCLRELLFILNSHTGVMDPARQEAVLLGLSCIEFLLCCVVYGLCAAIQRMWVEKWLGGIFKGMGL